MSQSHYTIQYKEGTNRKPSEAIIAAVSAGVDKNPVEMETLYNYVDLDAVDTLFQSRTDRKSHSGRLTIEFSTPECHVTITPSCVDVQATQET
jgi:hypothetical protein